VYDLPATVMTKCKQVVVDITELRHAAVGPFIAGTRLDLSRISSYVRLVTFASATRCCDRARLLVRSFVMFVVISRKVKVRYSWNLAQRSQFSIDAKFNSTARARGAPASRQHDVGYQTPPWVPRYTPKPLAVELLTSQTLRTRGQSSRSKPPYWKFNLK